MVGEASNHREKLLASLARPADIVALPREAAGSAEWDSAIGPDDAVISLRFKRPAASPPFRLLHVPGAGLDGIDLDSVPSHCAICNVFEHEIPIAEFVLLSILEWTIGLGEMRRGFTPATWSNVYRARPAHGEIYGKTLGLLGFGRIGRAIAARAKAFGVRILALDANANDPAGLAEEILPPSALPRLLAEADFLAIACPLTEQTRGLLDADAFAKMKPSAVLLNISRAEIADETALYRALASRQIAGAFLDVWYRYPIDSGETVAPSQQLFHALPNVWATPHSSGWSDALPHRRYAVIAENLRRLEDGKPLLNLVRPA